MLKISTIYHYDSSDFCHFRLNFENKNPKPPDKKLGIAIICEMITIPVFFVRWFYDFILIYDNDILDTLYAGFKITAFI